MNKQVSQEVLRAFFYVTGCSASNAHGRVESAKRNSYRFIWLMLALVAFPVGLYSQTDTATILGTVADASGAAVAGAMVTVTDTGTNTTTVVKSNASGAYVATPLRIGNYSVSVESQGFKTETRNGIVLQVQDRLQGRLSRCR